MVLINAFQAAQNRERDLAVAVASYRRVEERRMRSKGLAVYPIRPIGLASLLAR